MTAPARVAHDRPPRLLEALADVLVTLAAVAGRVRRSPFAADLRAGLDHARTVLGAVAAVWLVVELVVALRPLGEWAHAITTGAIR